MKSGFFRHLWLWLLLPAFLIFSLPAVPQLGLFQLSAAERAANAGMLGAQQEQRLFDAANATFRRTFVDSGVVTGSFRTLTHWGRNIFAFADDRRIGVGYLSRVWESVAKAVYRYEVAKRWLFVLGVLLLASAIDGGCQRMIKNTEFGYSNPVAFHLSGHGFISLLGILFITPFFPFAIQQWVWPVLLLAGCMVVWKACESYQSSL